MHTRTRTPRTARERAAVGRALDAPSWGVANALAVFANWGPGQEWGKRTRIGPCPLEFQYPHRRLFSILWSPFAHVLWGAIWGACWHGYLGQVGLVPLVPVRLRGESDFEEGVLDVAHVLAVHVDQRLLRLAVAAEAVFARQVADDGAGLSEFQAVDF